jgi:type I restriction enzyme, S subunit
MVPEGWMHTTFDKHIDCLTGFAFKSDGYSFAENDIRLLRGDNIEPGGLRWRDAKLWPKNELDDLDRYQLQEGDFVIALDRTWISNGLKVAEVTSKDLPCLLVQRVARVRAKHSLEQSLLRQYFSGNRFEQYVKSVQTATAVPHISPNDIKEFTLLLPTVPEQKKIAQILSTWDQAISANERLLENSQQRKKGLMQQLLTGKKRLPGFEGEWASSILTHHCSVVTGNKDLQNKVEDGEYPFFVRSSNIERINSYSFDGEAILIPGDGRVGEIFHYIDGKFDFHQRVYKLSDFKGALGLFIYYYLKRFFKAEVIKNSVKATVDSLRMPVFTGMHIKLPSLEEQQSIVDVLACSDIEIQVISQRLELLKQEKKALMQLLLTGKRRVQRETEAA